MHRADLLEKTLMVERLKAKGERAAEDEMVDSIINSMDMNFEKTLGDSEGQEILACCSSWGRRVRHDLASEQQQQQRDYMTQPNK